MAGDEIPRDVSRRDFLFDPAAPHPFVSCHASTVLPLAGGDVLAAWFAGPYESHPDVAIWMARRGTSGWSTPTRVAGEAGLPHWNPVLALSPRGRLHLFYKVGPNVPAWRSRVMTSDDAGRTWSAPRELDAVGGFPPGPVKDKPIALSDGTWIAPTSRETASEWNAAVTLSSDDGASWSLGGPVPIDRGRVAGKGVIQPTLWESARGSVHMLLRSTCGRICRSDSADGGRTWSPVEPTDLPNNNSGIDVERLPDGTLALCCNPVGADWGKRTPLVLVFSRDNGRTWGGRIVLEDEDPPLDEAKVKLDKAYRPNEFSYPAVVYGGPGGDRALHVTYTWKRSSIAYRRVRGISPEGGRDRMAAALGARGPGD